MSLITNTALTMTSQEIADLVGSRHDDVKRSIARLAGRGVIQLPPMAEVRNHLGQAVSVYQICKRDSFVVVAQLSPEFTAALVDRWQELEDQAGSLPIVPQSLPEALRLAADLAEQKAALALENRQQAVKIETLENLFMTGETPTQFCKRLNGVNCSQVNSSLLKLGWLFNAATDERSKPRYRVSSRVRDHYLTEHPRKIGAEGGDPFIKYDLILLLAGARRLHQLYLGEKLAMKAKWDGRFTQLKYTGDSDQ
ncbi:Rha family transcriptional regulator [Pseudomonas sp. GD04058]|uniref:Rha family transcriptional regulator n=1 Tax=Pseudomonas sp. GD04058 TaxID=2975429 RepID=UPI0024475350|nr:Rha family transcriptional regulator [Pseudomonas sp. GD04058]MDG9884130.1 Rha family transcriptional regulator [Pseudomonas sp. GD04058]